jgi:hypothetical protein
VLLLLCVPHERGGDDGEPDKSPGWPPMVHVMAGFTVGQLNLLIGYLFVTGMILLFGAFPLTSGMKAMLSAVAAVAIAELSLHANFMKQRRSFPPEYRVPVLRFYVGIALAALMWWAYLR